LSATLRGVARFRVRAAPRLALGTARRAALRLAWRALEILRLDLRAAARLAAAAQLFFRLFSAIPGECLSFGPRAAC
jgi:hypothetical protein